ncbi:hypothetical protein CF327_g1167 [Tilletia walkeri]|nr:hypothetical protein CF327_g1167 [Tilletia walkeri]
MSHQDAIKATTAQAEQPSTSNNQQLSTTPRNLHITLPPPPTEGELQPHTIESSTTSMSLPPPPAHGILLSRLPTSAVKDATPGSSPQKIKGTFIASPPPLSKDDDDEKIFGRPTNERTPTTTSTTSQQQHQQQASHASTGSKLSTLMNKLGRRTGSSSNAKGTLGSHPSGDAVADHSHHKKSKSIRNGSGRHTPVVEGEYGQFLAAAELQVALEREQIKAAKRAEKEKPSGKGSKVNPAAAAAAQKVPPGGPVSKAQAVAMKPSRSLPGAFGSLSRASSERRADGTITPKGRRAATDLRAPNPCGMPIDDSDSEEEEEENEHDSDGEGAHDYLDDGALGLDEDGEGEGHHHHSPESRRRQDGHDDKRKKQRVSSSSFGRRRPFFSRAKSNESTPRGGSRRSSFSSSASSDDSIVRTSYPADLAALNARELRSAALLRPSTDVKADGLGLEESGEGADPEISSTRSIKSWRSHPSGTSSISGGGLSSDSNVVLSKPLLELEEFELDNFIKNFSRHTKEVRVPVTSGVGVSRRMPQWSDFKVPANEAELAAAEGRRVTVLTHVDRGLQAILQAGDGMGSSAAAAASAIGSAPVQGVGTTGAATTTKGEATSAHAGGAHVGGEKHLSLLKRKGSSGGAGKQEGSGASHPSGANEHSNKKSKVSSEGRALIQTAMSANGHGTISGPAVPESPHIKWAAGATDGRGGVGGGAGGGGSGPTSPSHSAANSPIFSFTQLFPDNAHSARRGGGVLMRGSDGSMMTTTTSTAVDGGVEGDDAQTLDDGWEVVEGVAVKHEDGKALLEGLGASESGHHDFGQGIGPGVVGGVKEEEEQVDAVAFVIAYILAMVERYAPEELDDGPDDRYREGKLRSHLERLYIIAPFWERFLLGVRSLYRWEQPRRTGAAAMIYFVLWYTDLIPTAFMLSLLYYILQFRFFPPSESFLHEQVRKRMSRGIEADKFSEQLRRRSRLDLLDLYKHWIDRYGVASQVAAGDIADFHEKVKNLILWRNPTATWRTFGVLSTATLFVTFAPAHYVWKIALFFLGLSFFILLPLQSHYPRYRRPLSPIWWALWGSPTDFMWGSKILRERHAKLHLQQAQALSESRGGTKEGKTHLYHGLFHSRKAGGRHAHDVQGATSAGAALDALAMSSSAAGTPLEGDSDEARKEMISEQLKEAQRGKKLASFFCQHNTIPGHLHVTTKMIYFVALHSTRPSNSRKTCKSELSDIAGLVKTNNFRLLGFHGLKIRKRDGKSMHFSNMSHRDDAFNLILSVTGTVWSKV